LVTSWTNFDICTVALSLRHVHMSATEFVTTFTHVYGHVYMQR